jgi:uncharacterized protein (DUF433 family)
MTLSLTETPVPLTMDADGVVRVARTRVTLNTVVAAFAEGATAEEIMQQYPSLDLADVYQYPSLDLADVYSVLAYYLRHRSEVDAYVHERQEQAEAVRKDNESCWDPFGVRDRLLARKVSNGS